MPVEKNRMRKQTVLSGFLLLLALNAGCGKTDQVYFSTEVTSEHGAGGLGQDTEAVTEQETEEKTVKPADSIVYVCGAVVRPGVYALPSGSRIYEAVVAAGGMLENAAYESLNQAEKIQDGQMIVILTKEEMQDGQVQEGSTQPDMADGRVNLNTATKAQLMTLPGIGEAKADSIIAYREKNGGFSSIDDIKKIEGIKEGVFAKIKDSIAVN